MAGGYYAAQKGKDPGLYESWNECQKQVIGFQGANYKKFKTKSEAMKYILEENEEDEEVQVSRPDGDNKNEKIKGKERNMNSKKGKSVKETKENVKVNVSEVQNEEEEAEQKVEGKNVKCYMEELEQSNKCKACEQILAKEAEAVRCDRCKRWVHKAYGKVPEGVIETLCNRNMVGRDEEGS